MKQLTERDVIELIKRYSRGSGSGGGTTHARLHAITSTLDHTSQATPGSLLMADVNGLPVDAVRIKIGPNYSLYQDGNLVKIQYSATGADPWTDTGNEWGI